MIGLLQRVQNASVVVGGECVGAIQQGLLVLVGVERNDSRAQADRLLERLLTYRVFADADGKMNRSVRDICGGLLLVPQFTLPADTRKGARPSFTPAADPALGEELYGYLVDRARASHESVEVGIFGVDMQVGLVNDGPVTFWLQVKNPTGC